MVEVHDHFLVSHFKHLAGDAVTVLSHHGNDSAYFHVLVVKLTVDFKNLFLKMSHLLGIIFSESFLGRNLYVKFIAGSQSLDSFLQGDDDAAGHSENDFFRIFSSYLMHQLIPFRIHFIEVIYHLDIFAGFNLFHNYII